jgi:integrase
MRSHSAPARRAKSTSEPATDRERYALDPTRRWSTRYVGVRYRLNRTLDRTYFVYWKGQFVPAGHTIEEALAKQGELRKSAARGEKPILPTKTTFDELAEKWWAQKAPRLRRKTQVNYRSALDLVLLPRFGSWRIAAIDADAISALIHDLQASGLHVIDKTRKPRPLGRSSVENYLKPLQGTLKLAVRRGLIGVNPFDVLLAEDRPKPEPKRPPHVWSPHEVDALLEASASIAARPEARYDYTPLLRLTSALGLRLGEVLGLTWEDFDTDESVLHVRRQWTRFGEYTETKTKAGVRRIALPAALRSMLIELKLRAPGDTSPIFASKTGTPLSHRNVTLRGFEAARDEAGLPSHLTFHELRHVVASRLISANVDPVTTANVLGHEDPHVTLRVYAHLYDREKTDAKVRAALEGSAA